MDIAKGTEKEGEADCYRPRPLPATTAILLSFFSFFSAHHHVSNTCQTVPNPLKQAALVVFEGLEPFEHAARNVCESSKPPKQGSFAGFGTAPKRSEHAQRPEIGLKSPSQRLSNLFERLDLFERLEP